MTKRAQASQWSTQGLPEHLLERLVADLPMRGGGSFTQTCGKSAGSGAATLRTRCAALLRKLNCLRASLLSGVLYKEAPVCTRSGAMVCLFAPR